MTFNIILIITIFLNVLLSIFVFTQNPKSPSHRLFSFLALLGALWTFANYMTSTTYLVVWLVLTYALGSLVISCGLIWTIILTDKSIPLKKIVAISVSGFAFFILSLQNGFLTNFSLNDHIGASSDMIFEFGLYLYSIFYLLLALTIIWKLYTAQKTSDSTNERSQYRFVLFGAFISLLASAFTTFVIPDLEISVSGSLDGIGFLVFLVFVSYSITRHQLFNIRVIAIELVTFGLWVVILIKALLADTRQEIFTEISLLIIAVIFGIMLIRGTLHEIKQRERIEKLANDLRNAYTSLKDFNDNLEKKVLEQTAEIKQSYEVEKSARKLLEKMNKDKDELVSAAQHNLRTPLTALRWQLETIQKNLVPENDYELKRAIDESSESVKQLTAVLEDFLDITALTVRKNG